MGRRYRAYIRWYFIYTQVPELRQVLARHITLRHTADYAPELVTQTQAARALQRTRDFLAAIREKANAHES